LDTGYFEGVREVLSGQAIAMEVAEHNIAEDAAHATR
jgi:hypothetical protein